MYVVLYFHFFRSKILTIEKYIHIQLRIFVPALLVYSKVFACVKVL